MTADKQDWKSPFGSCVCGSRYECPGCNPDKAIELAQAIATNDERRKHAPCMECGAKDPKDAESKCLCSGDKDDCHGCELWPDDAAPAPSEADVLAEQFRLGWEAGHKAAKDAAPAPVARPNDETQVFLRAATASAERHRSRVITERGRFEYALKELVPAALYERIRFEAYSRPQAENDHQVFADWVRSIDDSMDVGEAVAVVGADGYPHWLVGFLSGTKWARAMGAGTKLYLGPQSEPAPAVGGERVDYWCAVDADDCVEFGMSADDANDGEAARQEMNDWINDQLNEVGSKYRLVGLYAHPPAPQGDEPQSNPLLDVARRNIRSFIAIATFPSEVDRWSAGQCLDVIDAAITARTAQADPREPTGLPTDIAPPAPLKDEGC